MCGIAGMANPSGIDRGQREALARMLRSMSHRGPDDQHVDGDERGLLGARRLSIIDVEGGRQPLTEESGRIFAAQNGEIYNYIELRDELIRRGHSFRTHGDTETIVHLYEEFGDDFVVHLRGMFAISIWDSRTNRLVLARDRLGKKPVYWRLDGGLLTWGSELKAILAGPPMDRVIDRDALALYLQYQYVPAPLSILKGIAKLPPASVLTWDGGEPQVRRYWEPSFEKRTSSLEEDIEEGLRLLREAVRLRLRSDVPIGVFLSGGMDSSVVTALVAEASADRVRTFSIGFDSKQHDELGYARQVAELFDTQHAEEVVRIDAVDMLPLLSEHFDEPFGDSSALPTLKVSQMAGRELKVVLTGDGGDESFGGYARYKRLDRYRRVDRVPKPALAAALSGMKASGRVLGPGFSARVGRWSELASMDADTRYIRSMSIIGRDARRQLLRDPNLDTDPYLGRVLAAGPMNQLDRVMRADLLTYLPEDLLVKTDRASMAASLEARSPLLDQCVVEFGASLRPERKVHDGVSKIVLRAIAKRLMPDRIVERPKMGFAVPRADWFRNQLGSHFEEVVLASDAAARDHLDVSVGARLLQEHREGITDRSHDLWLLLTFELWCRRWLRSDP